MKIWITICCLVLASFSGIAEAGGGGRYHGGGWHKGGHGGWNKGGSSVGVWIGAPIVIGGPYFYPYSPYYYPYRYGYGSPVVREYVYERPAPAPAVVAPQSPTWYYCRESRAYYPYVHDCPGGWDSVPARPPLDGQP